MTKAIFLLVVAGVAGAATAGIYYSRMSRVTVTPIVVDKAPVAEVNQFKNAKLVQVAGEVSVRNGANVGQLAKENQGILHLDTVFTGNGVAKIEFEDGARVKVSNNSSVNVFKTQMDKGVRKVNLYVQGDIYGTELVKGEYEIIIPKVTVSVVEKAGLIVEYEQDVKLTLRSGVARVKIMGNSGEELHSFDLNAGETIEINDRNRGALRVEMTVQEKQMTIVPRQTLASDVPDWAK